MYSIEKFKKQSKINLVITSVIFLVCVIVGPILLAKSGDNLGKRMGGIVLLIIAFALLVFLLVMLVMNKVRTFNFQGHKIHYYIGMFSIYLFVDSKFVDKNHGRFTTRLETKINGKSLMLEFKGSSRPRVIYDSQRVEVQNIVVER